MSCCWRRLGCYVHTEGNPGGLSVTELEYLAAGGKPMPRLTFPLDDKARWPIQRRDADLARIQALRERLQGLANRVRWAEKVAQAALSLE